MLYFWEGEGEVKVFSLLLQETAAAEYMPPAPREGRKAVLSPTLNNETALVQHSEHTQQNALKINIHCSLKLTPITIPTSLPSPSSHLIRVFRKFCLSCGWARSEG